MKIYLVGGAVRNELLGIPANDLDYVVVGSTEQEMLDEGFTRVGNDFPVFLHPTTGDEYALARREKSTGRGYNDFAIEFGPDVTLKEDLGRRDFTMNAIAKDVETGEIVDPFGGAADIKKRVIQIMYPTVFDDDPVRILRLARFLSQYPAFSIHEDAKFRAFVYGSQLQHATAERVGQELAKALMGKKPSRFFDTLRESKNLKFWFDEIYNLIGVIQPIKHHAEGDAYTHTMMVLDSAARHEESLEVRFGCLVHDLGKATTPKEILPSHHGHEARGISRTHDLCDRLKLPNDLRLVGIRSAEYHTHVHNRFIMSEKGFVRTYEFFKNCLSVVDVVGRVAFHDNEGKLPWSEYYDYRPNWNDKFEILSKVKLSNVYSKEEIEQMPIDRRKQILHKLRINSLK